jgi:signal transduction histidine kinase
VRARQGLLSRLWLLTQLVRLARWWLCLAAVIVPVRAAEPPTSGPPEVALVAAVIAQADAAPPREDDPRWRQVSLPHSQAVDAAWYRVEFERPAQAHPGWALYLPYWYGGGSVWLNGVAVGTVPQSDGEVGVRWERPFLLPLPGNVLRPGRNVLMLRAVEAHLPTGGAGLPRLRLGEQVELQPGFEGRLFVVRTLPMVTVVAGAVTALLALFVWLRRRDEVLLGLFGLATLCWAIRTLTFVFDILPLGAWPWWRLMYHAANGGFIVVLALFAWHLAGWTHRLVSRGLAALWAIGPLAYVVLLLAGGQPEAIVGRWWAALLIPVGASIAVAAAAAAWRRRDAGTIALAAAMVISFACGVHDYLVAWRVPWFTALAPLWADWTASRIFLLHHGANLTLLVMGAQLALRFARTLGEVEEANRGLEARVAAREREIAAGYERIATLQREQTRQDERQRIMQDLHDGLGSQLVTSLVRAERGALDAGATADTLRSSLDEMRVAIEALTADDEDFRTSFGNFRFRWDARLRDAGLAPRWQVQLPDEPLPLPASDALQVLRIAQEALANVLKHARAHSVEVGLRADTATLTLEVADDGVGLPTAERPGGRGMGNMRARARRLAAQFECAAARDGGDERRGALVRLVVPLRAATSPEVV